jgi:hypothetical protein
VSSNEQQLPAELALGGVRQTLCSRRFPTSSLPNSTDYSCLTLQNMTSFAWLKAMPVAPKADHIRELIDRLRRVRDIGLPSEITTRIHEERLRQFVREGYASDAHQLGRFTGSHPTCSRRWSFAQCGLATRCWRR